MDQLQLKQSAYIKKVNGSGSLRHHLLDMGLTKGTEVTLQNIAPMGDPIQIEVRGYELTLLYTPCVAAISTIRNEMGGRGAAIAVVAIQCAIAWCIAFLVYQLGYLAGLA